MIPKPFRLTDLEYLSGGAMFSATVDDDELANLLTSHDGLSTHDMSMIHNRHFYCYVHPLYDPETVWLELAYALEKAVADRQMWEAGLPEVEL